MITCNILYCNRDYDILYYTVYYTAIRRSSIQWVGLSVRATCAFVQDSGTGDEAQGAPFGRRGGFSFVELLFVIVYVFGRRGGSSRRWTPCWRRSPPSCCASAGSARLRRAPLPLPAAADRLRGDPPGNITFVVFSFKLCFPPLPGSSMGRGYGASPDFGELRTPHETTNLESGPTNDRSR